MRKPCVLVVADSAAGVPGLVPALSEGGFAVRTATEDQVLASGETSDWPDGLLVSASLGLQRVAMLARRFAHLPNPPTTVVFPQGDLGALEACVRGGFDYVLPPFLPSLLRGRLSSCWERGQLASAVEDMAAEASLRAYERDLAIAHEIQSGFLPDKLPAPHGWDVASRFRPARQVALESRCVSFSGAYWPVNTRSLWSSAARQKVVEEQDNARMLNCRLGAAGVGVDQAMPS